MQGLLSGVRGAAIEACDPAHVQNPLSDLILAGKVHDGDTVRIGVRDGALTLNGEAVKAAA